MFLNALSDYVTFVMMLRHVGPRDSRAGSAAPLPTPASRRSSAT